MVRRCATLSQRYAMNVKADANLMTIKRTHGYIASEYTTDGDLCSSRENGQEFTVPSPMTATVVEPHAPMVLETFKSVNPMVLQILAFAMPILSQKGTI